MDVLTPGRPPARGRREAPDTFGQVLLEAQASGLPVVAVKAGGPASLIEHGTTGLLAPPEPDALAAKLVSLVSSPLLAERLRRSGLAAVGGRTWEAALEGLAAGYRRTLRERRIGGERSVA